MRIKSMPHAAASPTRLAHGSMAPLSFLFTIMRFRRTFHRGIDAVRNAVALLWSHGQAEGQIDRLKALLRTTVTSLCGSRCFLVFVPIPPICPLEGSLRHTD